MAQSHDASVDHLALAKQYIAIAESQDSKREAYAKAADEIIAAQKDDATLSNRAIAKSLGKHHSWVADLVQWRTSGGDRATPFAGSRAEQDPQQTEREARKFLASAPIEQIEQVMIESPGLRQKMAQAIEATHPAVRSKPPLDMPEPNAGYLVRMAGPITDLRAASKEFVETHERYAEGADEDEMESVRDDVAGIVSELSAAVSDWSLS